jgi:hypothetical protein
MGNYTDVIDGELVESKAQTSEIIFENKNNKLSVGDELGEYYSHPAFSAFDTNGLWIGKFETTGNQNNLTIKPNMKSLRDLNVKTIFEISYNYKRNSDSHMMKNTEWGAAAYLSLSNYGINKKINVNNNSDYMTGYSAVTSTNQSVYRGETGTTSNVTLPYNTVTGYLASTTGNISGIYDMSGGAFEYMASYIDTYLGNSGFESDPVLIYGEKYFNRYPSNMTKTSYHLHIKGDATGEFGPFYHYVDASNQAHNYNSWNRDGGTFMEISFPWTGRGSRYYGGLHAGQLNFGRYTGGNYNSFGFRMILINSKVFKKISLFVTLNNR